MTCLRTNDGVGASYDDNYLELFLKWRHLQNESLHGAPACDRRSGDRAHAIPWCGFIWPICGLHKWPMCGLYKLPICGLYIWTINVVSKSVIATLVIVLM